MYIHITHIFTQNIDFHNNFSISIWLDCMYIKETQVEKNYKNSQSHTENKPLLHQKISKITFLGLLLWTLVVVAVIPRASWLTHFRCTVTLCGENWNNWLVHNMCGKFFFASLDSPIDIHHSFSLFYLKIPGFYTSIFTALDVGDAYARFYDI